MTQQHRTTRTVYRGATEHLAHYGDSRAPDEVWTITYSDEPKLATTRTYEEVIASVGVTVDLSDELDRVEQVRAEGPARLLFPDPEGSDLTVMLYPGDLSTIRRALDAIEREWARLGVYAALEQSTDEPGDVALELDAAQPRVDLELPVRKCHRAVAGIIDHRPHEYDLTPAEANDSDGPDLVGTRVRCPGFAVGH